MFYAYFLFVEAKATELIFSTTLFQKKVEACMVYGHTLSFSKPRQSQLGFNEFRFVLINMLAFDSRTCRQHALFTVRRGGEDNLPARATRGAVWRVARLFELRRASSLGRALSMCGALLQQTAASCPIL